MWKTSLPPADVVSIFSDIFLLPAKSLIFQKSILPQTLSNRAFPKDIAIKRACWLGSVNCMNKRLVLRLATANAKDRKLVVS
jgi:hypothetical protein